MKPHRRKFLHLAAGVAALPAASSIAGAQTYPSRPITIVVGFAAGGATDTIGRVIAERMKGSLGQPVIVEDVTGAVGTIAVGRVARAAPDGYTLGLGTNTPYVMAGATYALQYDLIAALPQVRAGTIKAYGVTTKTRLLSAPDIPTLDEAGLPGFDISQWHGLWLPKGAPKTIIGKLNAAVLDALADPVVRSRLADIGQQIR
jgi:tripartite-type tricarboxylate transporter receptor subunit TctC